MFNWLEFSFKQTIWNLYTRSRTIKWNIKLDFWVFWDFFFWYFSGVLLQKHIFQVSTEVLIMQMFLKLLSIFFPTILQPYSNLVNIRFMVQWQFYNYLCNQCLLPLTLWVQIPLRHDKVCQWLATGWWFSPCTTVSITNKADLHDITEILLKVVLNTIKQTNLLWFQSYDLVYFIWKQEHLCSIHTFLE